jgi:hypothetical protein
MRRHHVDTVGMRADDEKTAPGGEEGGGHTYARAAARPH